MPRPCFHHPRRHRQTLLDSLHRGPRRHRRRHLTRSSLASRHGRLPTQLCRLLALAWVPACSARFSSVCVCNPVVAHARSRRLLTPLHSHCMLLCLRSGGRRQRRLLCRQCGDFQRHRMGVGCVDAHGSVLCGRRRARHHPLRCAQPLMIACKLLPSPSTAASPPHACTLPQPSADGTAPTAS